MRWLALLGLGLLAYFGLLAVLRWKAAEDAADRATQMHISDEQTQAAIKAAKYHMGGGIAGGLGSAIGGIASALGRVFR